MEEETTLVCVDPAHARDMWPHAAPLIELGAASDNERIEHYRDMVMTGAALLWIAWAGEGKLLAATITRIVADVRGRVCILGPLGGESLERWRNMHRDIEAYAKQENCVAVRIIGRTGWTRVLPDYWPVAVILEKAL